MMKPWLKRWRLVVSLVVAGVAGAVQAAPERVVSLGGSVTEIVYALGQGGLLVADDDSSLYPEAATQLPSVGYYRAVPVEGVVAQSPDLVLASENAGPPTALARLTGLGLSFKVITDQPTLASLYQRVEDVAQALQVPTAGQALAEKIRGEVAVAQQVPATPLRALVLVNRTGPWLAAGGNTTAGAILELAGLENAMASQQGYKPIAAEGMAMLAPELIIVTQASLRASGGMERFLSRAGIASTPAAKNKRVVEMDDLLIQGMGPRVGLAIRQLKDAAR